MYSSCLWQFYGIFWKSCLSSHKISSHLQRNQPDFILYAAQTINGLEIPIGLELPGLPYDIAHVDISTNTQKDPVKVKIFHEGEALPRPWRHQLKLQSFINLLIIRRCQETLESVEVPVYARRNRVTTRHICLYVYTDT